MTDDAPITSESELAAALGSVLQRGREGGIGVSGGWEAPTNDGHDVWDVVVTEVHRDEDAE